MQGFSQKPENVLKRAEECVSVGKKEAAIQIIFEMLSNKRGRTWQQAHEPLMLRYLELCMDIKSSRFAKEGLHQYRNMTVQQAPNSLEKVIEFMLESATTKTDQAAKDCNAQTVMREIEDLENDKSPEAVLLEAVTADKTKERTEREILVPWLKYLWESFRTVIELLRYQTKLEDIYHKTARKAFAFCKEYQRSTEFRRLCEMLRSHLFPKVKDKEKGGENVKYDKESATPTMINLLSSNEAMAAHLETRFEQLKVASSLRIWHEGFKTIEDIHYIMELSNKKPSNKLMASYYQKLTQLFLVSENYLFHAYAHKAYYMINKEKNKSMTKEDSKVLSSTVLLAAMSIPLQNSKAGMTINEESAQREKNRRMAQLLAFDINPKRKSLINDLLSKNILESVFEEVRDLFILLEQSFAPMELSHKAKPLLEFLRNDSKLQSYVKPIEELLVIRLVSQLSTIFSSIKLDHLRGLLTELGMNYIQIEKTLVKAVKARQVSAQSVQIDHRENCIRFGENLMEEDGTRNFLTQTVKALQEVCDEMDEIDAKVQKEKFDEVEDLVQLVGQADEPTVMYMSERSEIINLKRAEFETYLAEKEKFKKDKRREVVEDMARQERERAQRQLERKERENQEKRDREIKMFEMEQKMLDEGVSLSAKDLVNMSDKEREKLINETKEKTERKMLEQGRKLAANKKRVDALVRATREVEKPKIESFCAEEQAKEEEKLKNKWKKELVKTKEQHAIALEAKARMKKMQAVMKEFEKPIMKVFQADYARELANRIEVIKTQQRLDKIARARKKLAQAKEEQQRKEEEAQRKREEEERRQKLRELELQQQREEDELRNSSRGRYNKYDDDEKDEEPEEEKVWTRTTYKLPEPKSESKTSATDEGPWRRNKPAQPANAVEEIARPSTSTPNEERSRPRFFNSALEGKSKLSEVTSSAAPLQSAVAVKAPVEAPAPSDEGRPRRFFNSKAQASLAESGTPAASVAGPFKRVNGNAEVATKEAESGRSWRPNVQPTKADQGVPKASGVGLEQGGSWRAGGSNVKDQKEKTQPKTSSAAAESSNSWRRAT